MKIDISIKEIEGEGYLCIRLLDLTVLKKSRAFIPPTIEEVKEYCKERKNSVNVVQWMAHYESNGWLVGKNKMKDWRAAVRTWEHSQFSSVIDDKGVIHRGANLADPPPEFFGVRSPTAVPMPEHLKKKLGKIGTEK